MSGNNKKEKNRFFEYLKNSRTVKHLKLEWCELDLSSKYILLIGIILLLELITAIFFYPAHSDVSITIVFRTSLSSVMGYILGGMNTPLEKSSNPPSVPPPVSLKDSNLKCSSGFKAVSTDEHDQITLQRAKNIRAIAAATVCMLCIIIIFIAHAIHRLDYAEGLIQMRDLISTTLGYLISKSSKS